MKKLMLFVLIILFSCGTRKTSQQKTTFKSDSLSIENTRVLKQNIELRDIYSIKPFDALKPMIIDGKELYATNDISDLQEGEIAITELRTEEMENPYFNFETKTFYNKN